METVEEYLKRAEEAAKLAMKASSKDEQELILKISELWLEMAEQRRLESMARQK